MTETLHIFAEDNSPDKSWQLLEWCLGKGADEFSINLIGVKEGVDRRGQLFDQRFERFRLEDKSRRRLSHETDGPSELWRLNRESLEELKGILPDGLFSYEIADAWFEDLHVYRSGELLLGIVTSEKEGVLRVTTAEKNELDELGVKYRFRGEWVGY